MRRTLLIATAALVLASAPSPVHAAAPSVRLDTCATGATPLDRSATFTGSMKAGEETNRMWMRFDLQERPPRARGFRRVKAAGFGTWERSRRGVPAFIFTKRVSGLAAPASYRVVVRFRWYQAPGLSRRDRIRRTPVCRQPDQRPNLRVESLRIEPGADDATRRYVVTVLNAGESAAGAFDVGLVTTRDDVRSVPGLPARERATVEIDAPACPMGERVAAQADVRGAVNESSERDNRFIAACDGR